MKRIPAVLAFAAFLGALALWGCKNENLFGRFHEKGTGDNASVLSDAKSALARREFANAAGYYETILSKDPRNSEALYGAATATMGSAGLDLGTLIANVMTTDQAAAPAARALSDGLRSAAMGAPGAATADDPLSLLYGLDIVRLDRALDRTICFLRKIRSGNTDGVVKPDNINMLVNLAVCSILRSVTRPYTEHLIDIRTTSDGKDYTIVILSEANVKASCGIVDASARDLANAYQAIKEASLVLKQKPGDTLYDLRLDMRDAFGELKMKIRDIPGVPAACTDFLVTVIIDTYDGLSSDPGNCLAIR